MTASAVVVAARPNGRVDLEFGIGYGDDNGNWSSDDWTKHALLLGPAYTYYYPAWMTL